MNPLVLVGLGVGVLLRSGNAYAQRVQGYQMTKEQRTQFILKLAAERNIPPAVALAIFSIESGGAGFYKGRMIIRFEPAKFRKYAGVDISYSHAGQNAEWDTFTRASQINKEAALKAISMGVGQVMGFNYKAIGYPSPQAMFDALSASEEAQVKSFFDYVRAANLENAARTGDWLRFARGYNGEGQKGYDLKMAEAYASFVKKGFGGIA